MMLKKKKGACKYQHGTRDSEEHPSRSEMEPNSTSRNEKQNDYFLNEGPKQLLRPNRKENH